MPTKYKTYIWGLYPNGSINYQHTEYNDISREQLFSLVKANQNAYNDENFDINNHKQYLFEVAYNKYDNGKNQNIHAKYWLDIDNISIEYSQLQDLLTDLFNKTDFILNEYKIDRKAYLVYYKHIPNSNKIHSLRIINYKYSADYDNMRNIAITLKDHTDNILCSNIDANVYRTNRQICLPYNSKILTDKYEKNKDIYGNLKNKSSSTHLFIDYNYNNDDHTKLQTKDCKKYLISYTAQTEQVITYTNLTLEKERSELTQEVLNVDYSNRQQVILDTDNILDVSIKTLPKEAFLQEKNIYWISYVKLLKPILTQKELEKFLKHSTTFDTPNYTYEKNIKFSNRLTYSANDKNYRIRNYGKKHYAYICNYLNKIQDKIYFYINELFCKINDISVWISKTANIEYDIPYKALHEIKDLSPQQIKEKYDNELELTENVRYNVKTGYLYCSNGELKNYYAEREYFVRFNEANQMNLNKYDLITDKLTDDENKLMENISEIIDKFIAGGSFKTLIMEMKWATGKSYYICKKILRSVFDNEYNRELNDILKDLESNDKSYYETFYSNGDIDTALLLSKIKRQLIVSPNNSLNRKENKEILDMSGNCFITHLALQKIQTEKNNTDDEDKLKSIKTQIRFYQRHLNMISSVESIDNFKITDYKHDTHVVNEDAVDCVILDEFNTILNNFDIESSTFKGFSKKNLNDNKSDYIPKMENNINHLINICKIAKKVLIMDADICFEKLEWFLNKIEANDDVYKIKVDFNKFVEEGYKIYICENQDTLVSNFLSKQNDIQELVCVSNNKAKDLFISLIIESFDKDFNLLEQYKNECYGLISGDGLCIFDCRDFSKSILSKKLFVLNEVVDTKLSSIKQIHQAKYEIAQQEQQQTLHNIITKHSVKFIETGTDKDEEVINEYKKDFFDNYDARIRIDYKFTKYVRTPTIKCGISLNPIYFNELYFFIYFGVLTIEEILQMVWRSRNLHDKNIYITFQNRHFCEWKEYFSLEYIQNRIENKTNYGDENSKFLIDIDNPIYKKPNSSNIKQLIMLNEKDKLNSTMRSVQLFMDRLFYHGFRLNESILFLRQQDRYGEDYLKEAKKDRIETLKLNFLNIDILQLNNKQINHIKNKKNERNEDKESKNKKISEVFRMKYNKYMRMNKYLQFHSVFQIFLVKKLLEDQSFYLDEIDNTENKPKWTAVCNDNVLEDIHRLLEMEYINNINVEDFVEFYKLHNRMSAMITKSLQVKSLLKMEKILTEEQENYDPTELTNNTPNSVKNELKLKTDKLLITLLKFLGIDLLTDFNKENIKRFIVKNNKLKFKITGFITEILSNENIINIDGNDIYFLKWLVEVVIDTDYNHQENIQKINKKKLDAVKDLQIIKRVINHYLNKIFLYFDYENQLSNSSKMLNNLQFVIKKEVDIKITNEALINQYKFLNKCNINQTLCDNDKICICETYTRNINEIVVKNKQIDKQPTIHIYKDNIDSECVVNENIVIRPTKYIKRLKDYKYYYKNEMINFTEKIVKYKPIVRMESDIYKINNRVYKQHKPNENKINQVINYIDRNVKIIDNFDRNAFTDNIVEFTNKYIFNESSFTCKELNITKVKRKFYLQEYKILLDTGNADIINQAYKKYKLNIELNKKIEPPIIVLNEELYKNDFINKCYKILQNPNVVEVST